MPYWRIDAFVGPGLLGNPAALIECERWPDDQTMQAIARESGGTATAFLVPDQSGAADWQVRWFGLRQEIRLCGHATLASAHILLQSNQAQTVSFRTRHGDILVAERADSGVALRLPTIQAERQEWLEAESFLGRSPLATYRADNGYAVFLFDNEADIRSLAPDLAGLAELGNVQLTCTASGKRSDVVSRVFSDGVEDTATGSAHAVLAPIWAQKLARSEFSAIQLSKRGGQLECRLDGESVILTGRCRVLIEGRFYLAG